MLTILVALAQWLTYSGDDRGTRHSAVTEISPSNVRQLRAVWTFQTGVLGKWESSPLVVDDVVYATGPDNVAWAIDAKTGRTKWRYARQLPDGIKPCCGRVNRGFAIYKDKLLMGTLDAYLIALDRTTGAIVYDVVVDDFRKAYTITGAPLIVGDKAIVGIGGAEYGVRGFLAARFSRASRTTRKGNAPTAEWCGAHRTATARCGRSIRQQPTVVGSTAPRRPRCRAPCPRRQASSSAAISTATSSRSMPGAAKNCGDISSARRCTRRR